MGLLGGLIGGVANIFGGISAAKAMNKYYTSAKNNIASQASKNESWYNRRYNEPATERADAQALLTRTEDIIRQRNRQAAGVQAVMGGTDESVAAAKEANNAALAQTAASIVANADQRKDAIENQYMQRDAQLADKQNALNREEAYNKADAIKDATLQVGGMAKELESIF